MKINHFGLYWRVFQVPIWVLVWLYIGQNRKKADLSLKISFFQFFRSRFGFLVQFYPYPELEIKKYAHGQELLIFGVFLRNWPTVDSLGLNLAKKWNISTHSSQFNSNIFKILTENLLNTRNGNTVFEIIIKLDFEVFLRILKLV
jgi:hypothetical protein